ncbi:hypothetical protein [Thiomicrorhabdus indica]|uniref:hypothetical protein n=1 Tax=Thiomicrorhabdus indica TaxID=2267253 RepID=UPI002AA6EDB8|nr:hypothetical protein [Thiomicrorhabdus indica]
MLPGNGNFKNIVADTNISAQEALARFDANIELLEKEGIEPSMMEFKMKELSTLSAWLQEALEKGETMESLKDRAQRLAKISFELGCCREEVECLLTIYPKY